MFHVHVGYQSNNIDTSLEIVRYMDVFVGIPSLLFDNDTRRRSLYGKAGSFRLTSYGLEYRTLSSKMLETDETIRFVYKQTMKALEGFQDGWSLPSSQITEATINNSNVEKAKYLIKKYHIL